jgi:hypothetical protein
LNKFVVTAIFFVVTIMMAGNAAAISCAYGTVYQSDELTPVYGATVQAYKDKDYKQQIGADATSAVDGTYSIDLGDFSGNTVNIKAFIGKKEGTGSGNIESHGSNHTALNLYLSNVKIDIPDYPKVALSIAAIIGLMFIINLRKK